MRPLLAIGIQVGAGGQAIGLMGAGFDISALIEPDRRCAETLICFPTLLDIVECLTPKAIMVDHPEMLLTSFHRFRDCREEVQKRLEVMGYKVETWHRFRLKDFGVPQAGSIAVLIALRKDFAEFYSTPPTGAMGASDTGSAP
ncbi:DNA cytosine methyltransferase [Streptomyces mirabilis]|uniref:DNA cytosine methyltransferase n=1 Tax=Streptomyces mirabilis TaxID=68239 RepID=UPI00332E8ACD